MSRLTKIIIILLIIFGIIGGGSYWLYSSLEKVQSELDAVAKPMTDDLAAEGWSRKSIDRYASADLEKWLTEHKIEKNIPEFEKLGKVKIYKGIQKFQTFESGMSSHAHFITLAQFEGGDAYVEMNMSKHNGKWQIDQFNVNYVSLTRNFDSVGGENGAR